MYGASALLRTELLGVREEGDRALQLSMTLLY